MNKYMECLAKNQYQNTLCREESKDYLECRMRKWDLYYIYFVNYSITILIYQYIFAHSATFVKFMYNGLSFLYAFGLLLWNHIVRLIR